MTERTVISISATFRSVIKITGWTIVDARILFGQALWLFVSIDRLVVHISFIWHIPILIIKERKKFSLMCLYSRHDTWSLQVAERVLVDAVDIVFVET